MRAPGARRDGFTIVELLVTVVIVGILASGVLPMVELTVQRAKERELREALRSLRTAIDAYKRAADEGRISRKADQSGYPPTLEVLVEGVPDIRDPKARKLYFLRAIPQDPFVLPESTREGIWGLRSYASSREDPREGEDVFDVYSRAPGTGLNGTPYRQW